MAAICERQACPLTNANMKLQIERPYFEALASSFPGLASLGEQLRFGDRVEVAFGQL